MAEHYILKLESGKTVWASRRGEILGEFDESGNLNSGCLTSAEKREAQAIYDDAQNRVAHETATSRQADPRFSDVRDEILHRYSPEAVSLIDRDPSAFESVYGPIREEVGKSYAELDADVARADEKAGIEDRLREQAADPLGGSQDMADISRLLTLKDEE